MGTSPSFTTRNNNKKFIGTGSIAYGSRPWVQFPALKNKTKQKTTHESRVPSA
jgi:hypothetical protein